GARRLVADTEAHRDRGVLHVLVSLRGLEVGQWGRAARAIGHHLEALGDPTSIPDALERPPDRLHVGRVHGLVVVVEVDPAAHPAHRLAPFGGVAQHDAAARLVEAGDAVALDVAPRAEAELLLHLVLDRQAVAVPTEPALDPEAAHGAVARHDVLD